MAMNLSRYWVFYTGMYHGLPLTVVIYLPLFTCFYENLYSPIIMNLWTGSTEEEQKKQLLILYEISDIHPSQPAVSFECAEILKIVW